MRVVCVMVCVRACVRVCELCVRGGQRVCEGCVWVQALEEVQPRACRASGRAPTASRGDN